MRRIFVLYDAACGFCVRCAEWLALQPQLVAIECLAQDSAQVTARFPTLRALPKAELTVIDDEGGVYRGSKAWLMCLWALAEWRRWSYRLARPAVMPFARQAFELVSSNRHRINSWLDLRTDRELAGALARASDPGDAPRCESC